MADPYPIGSPLWWVQKIEKLMASRAQDLRTFDDYYEGNHPLAFATPDFRKAFGGLFNNMADNWTQLIVDAVVERINVEGFRLGKDEAGSRKAWAMWQANQLDADSEIAHTEAHIFGESHVIVWNNPDDDTVPSITVESPQQVYVCYSASDRRKRAAALKKWVDDDGYENATLYLPDFLYKYRSKTKVKTDQLVTMANDSSPARWQERQIAGEEWPLRNPLGVVPVVPLVNRPRLNKPGLSEIKAVIPLQDGVNKLVSDMLVASEFGAAPQRWATGLEIPVDPETKKPMPVFEHLVNRIWTAKNSNTTFGQFPQADLGVFVKAIELLVQHIASQTRTPPHYFALTGQFPSGESIKSAETGLVAKSRRKMRHFSETWEEVISLAFAVVGDDKRAAFKESEVIWGDPESRSESEHIDAVLKKQALEVPREQLWEDAGYTPQQIERFQQLVAARDIPAQLPPPPALSPKGTFPEATAMGNAEAATANEQPMPS